MQIPGHIQAALSIGAEVAEENVVVALEENGLAESVFGLSDQEFLAAATSALSGSFAYEVHRARRPVREWRYLELSAGGSLECTAAFVPEATGQKPPTAAAQLLAAAWFADPQVVANGQLTAQLVVSSLAKTGAHGKFARRLAKEWEEACPLVEGVNVPPIWLAKCQIGITDQARIVSSSHAALRFAELFLEAVSEVKTKWRFLSIYRTLEHGYLSELFNVLEGQFFATPRESVTAALAALDSELNQFITLAEGAAIKAHFDAFCDEFESIKSSGNSFAVAVDRSIDKSGQLKALNAKWKKGVLIFYKIRCAIVHAGMSSPMFDAYPDGTACLDRLLPISEAALLEFLGLSVA